MAGDRTGVVGLGALARRWARRRADQLIGD